jgi:hypothetical protein
MQETSSQGNVGGWVDIIVNAKDVRVRHSRRLGRTPTLVAEEPMILANAVTCNFIKRTVGADGDTIDRTWQNVPGW